MDSTEFMKVQRRARRFYEWARLRNAVIGFAPLLLLAAVAALVGHRVGTAFAIGTALFVLGTGLLWYGRDAKRAVLPGVLAGTVPFLFSLCAKSMGHACMGDSCMSICVPACTAGGVIAGVMISAATVRGRRGIGFWLAASGVGLLTAALGCSCVGVYGLVGLATGFAVAAIPGLVKAALRVRGEPSR